MAVGLKELYQKIKPLYDMELVTSSCFRKYVGWTHTIENPEFIKLLHGDELIFSVGVQYTSDEWLMDLVCQLIEAGASGFVLTLPEGKIYPKQVVDYCNQKEFPLFAAGWNTPYQEIQRLFVEMILQNEQRETNLSTALKNAVYYPENEAAYLPTFEHDGLYRSMNYMMAVLSCNAYQTEKGNPELSRIAREIQHSPYKTVVADEQDRLLILIARQHRDMVKREIQRLCQTDANVYVGLGTEVAGLKNLRESYENAIAAYQLTKTAIATNFLVYDELGIYKVLYDLKHPQKGDSFVQEVLGKLMDYDAGNGTDYIEILKAFFENDCSILHTSQAIYCHKNTLNYKMNKIKEILGCDIMTNENRTRIMVALYFIKMKS